MGVEEGAGVGGCWSRAQVLTSTTSVLVQQKLCALRANFSGPFGPRGLATRKKSSHQKLLCEKLGSCSPFSWLNYLASSLLFLSLYFKSQ